MNKATRALMSASELELLRAAEPKRLERLDEDDLCDLHGRIRRARNKYATLHRRQAGAQVRADASRGVAAERNRRTAAKAEVFEDVLARVSRRLARVAKLRAQELRAERLAAAKAVKTGGKRRASSRGSAKGAATRKPKARDDRARRDQRSPVKERATASARATGRRTQAKRDSR